MCVFDELIERRGDGSEKWNRYPPDVLPMWIADMDFRSPPAIVEALVERARFGVYGYQIYDDMPALLAGWLRAAYGCEAEADWIVPVHALVPALAQAASVRGGRVLIPVPTYMGILSAPGKSGAAATLCPLKNVDERYRMDVADMRVRAGSGAETLMLCNPHNPVGRVFTREELLEASAFAQENNLLVVSDEVHSELIFEGRHTPFWSVDEYARNNSITLMGPGKTCNVAGLPFGFAVIPNGAVRTAFKKAAYAISEPGVMHAAAARAAYGGACDGWKKELVAYLKGNRDVLEAGLRDISPEIRFPRIEGSYLQWVDFGALTHGESAASWLLRTAKIAANDGAMFYGAAAAPVPGRSCARLNFAAPRSRIACALQRIAGAVGL
ncbi:MAG: aminotransferase class I/II-fold pyridoxal phosphate-dependent enzyme [Spirochaetaceae bacterium]|jgi:cystathionine beta-lyase|nr:aminotransferase class I/II-fold pyridoxal phosphate-dependent enzyme [Spirochaetaceae bacterium]